MIPAHQPEPARHRPRMALAAYLRLLAACLEEEADMIEADPRCSDELLDRFRAGAVMLSLEDAPINVFADRSGGEHFEPPGRAQFRPA
jgi:hypothetical protein